jgi:hypothetical protein
MNRCRTYLIAMCVSLLISASCARIHPIQLAPPIEVPAGLVWGYGVEPIDRRPDEARRAAYLDAVGDLLSHGPVIVSSTVQDETRADQDSSSRTIETTFRLRAASVLEPRFVRDGVEDGFYWVVVGARESDIELGWEEFLAWRDTRIEEARVLFEQADVGSGPSSGLNRLGLLEASLQILEEAGAEMAPGLLYHRVRIAFDEAREQVVRLDRSRTEIDRLITSGDLGAAERILADAMVFGLSINEYESYSFQIADRRSQAEAQVSAGDTLYRGGQFKEAIDRYDLARMLDTGYPGLESRSARAESAHRAARAQTTSRTFGVIGSVVGEYFRWQREEARQDARAEAREDRRRDREDDRGDNNAGWEDIQSRPRNDRSGTVTRDRPPGAGGGRIPVVSDSSSDAQPKGGQAGPRAPERNDSPRSESQAGTAGAPAPSDGRGPGRTARSRQPEPVVNSEASPKPSGGGGRGPLAPVRNRQPESETGPASSPVESPNP